MKKNQNPVNSEVPAAQKVAEKHVVVSRKGNENNRTVPLKRASRPLGMKNR